MNYSTHVVVRINFVETVFSFFIWVLGPQACIFGQQAPSPAEPSWQPKTGYCYLELTN